MKLGDVPWWGWALAGFVAWKVLGDKKNSTGTRTRHVVDAQGGATIEEGNTDTIRRTR